MENSSHFLSKLCLWGSVLHMINFGTLRTGRDVQHMDTARCGARAKTYVRVGPIRTASSRFSEQRVWPQSMQISQVGPTVMRCILGSGSPFSETHFCRPNFKISGYGKCKNCLLKLVSESGRCCKFKYLGSKSTSFQRH